MEGYFVPPVDNFWEMLPTVEAVVAQLALSGYAGADMQLLADFDRAVDMALSQGWEGDFRQGHEPRVFWLPGEDVFLWGFAWKQDNNGSTIVISPQPLPWLAKWRLGSPDP